MTSTPMPRSAKQYNVNKEKGVSVNVKMEQNQAKCEFNVSFSF